MLILLKSIVCCDDLTLYCTYVHLRFTFFSELIKLDLCMVDYRLICRSDLIIPTKKRQH